MFYGVPQGSILGPLLSDINLTDLFLAEHYKSDFSDYADDTTPYNCRSTLLDIISDLEITLGSLLTWFSHSNVKANASKCYLFLSPFNAKFINPIQDGHFWGCSRMGGRQKDPLPKIFHTYPKMTKLGTVIP